MKYLWQILIPLILISPSHSLIGGVDNRDPKGLRKHLVSVRSAAGHCSATVISLSAAHCMAGNKFYISALNEVFLPTRFEVQQIILHPKFNTVMGYGKYPLYDIAIVVLKTPLPKIFTPVELPHNPPTEKEPLLVGGFGLTDSKNKDSALILHELPLKVVTFDKNLHEINLSPTGFLPITPTNAVCQGDSGGAALRKIGEKTEIIGVTSYATGPNINNKCGIKSVFSDVYSHLEWIKTALKKY
jgi:secreted trypsin-like serine protease